jgi:hypothetical protein
MPGAWRTPEDRYGRDLRVIRRLNADGSDSGGHAIEISAGDPARRVPVEAWAGNAGGQTPGSIGFYMSADMRRLVGGATSVQVWEDGKPVYHAILAGTPSATELDACVRPPSENSDQE